MSRRSRCPLGWVPLAEAAEILGLHPDALRRQVTARQFTDLRRTPGKSSAIYLLRTEIDAYLAGGIAAVAALKSVATPAATLATAEA